jgi:hypothetical protein
MIAFDEWISIKIRKDGEKTQINHALVNFLIIFWERWVI